MAAKKLRRSSMVRRSCWQGCRLIGENWRVEGYDFERRDTDLHFGRGKAGCRSFIYVSGERVRERTLTFVVYSSTSQKEDVRDINWMNDRL